MNERATDLDGRFWLAAGGVAATYGYFLLFAEFAFLELVRTGTAGEASLRIVMGALGAGGIAGSLAAMWRFGPGNFVRRLAWSYAACALAAALATQTRGQGGFALVAAGIGLALGWNTVTLAAGLRALLPAGRLGLGAGVGTGAAYALCNVPAVFTAPATMQTWLSAGLAAVAAVALLWARPVWREAPPVQRRAVWPWVGVFLALVWLDSAAFYVIQHTAGLRAETWVREVHLWTNALVHLLAAVAAGALLDRGWLRGLAGAAWLALTAACLALGAAISVPGLSQLYSGGVSVYSAALVYFAARDGRPWIAAAVFAVAGWTGSALGIGMAQDLHGVPWPFVLVSGIGLALALRPRVAAAVAVLGFVAAARPVRAGEAGALVAQGREVYIAEGCIHCHSQYVRSGVAADVERWGPAHSLEEILREGPPLPGNRRQGPDLSNVGNRRSPEWNRLHLQAPRAVSPGSRMPSYAHLFTPGDGRGEALVAYLASLGAGTLGEHWQVAGQWRPDPTAAVLSPAGSARLFAQSCAPCHGPEGRGDGPLAAGLALRPPDWRHDAWRRAPGGDELLLDRLIKFGAPGTAMAGHEALADGEIVGLARHVKSLHK